MENWDALKYFLLNLGLHNVILVILAAGLGLVLGRLLWARSAQGLVQLRERLAGESERVRDLERQLKLEQDRFRELRHQVESAEGGTVIINSPEVDEELAALRERTKEADATLEQMMLANAALEGALQALEAEKAEWEQGTTGREHDEAELAGLRAEIEVLRGEAEAAQAERHALELELKAVHKELEKSPGGGKADSRDRIAALEMELLQARNERKQVEEASAILRKELYGMRHELEELEKRKSLEKELDLALQDAEQRLARLQAEMTRSSLRREGRAVEVETEPSGNADGEVVKLPVEEEPPAVAGGNGTSAGATGGDDDLTRIKGIGGVLAKRLQEAGVTSFRQIADWTDAEVEEVSATLSLGKRVEKGNWREQARELAGD